MCWNAVLLYGTGRVEPGFSYLGRQKLWTEEAMDRVIQEASGKGRAEMVSYLMEEKRRLFAKRKKTFDL